MSLPERWKHYRPDPAILELLAELRAQAERGEIRSMAVVTISPMLETTPTVAGIEDDSGVRQQLLAAGLIKISNTLLK